MTMPIKRDVLVECLISPNESDRNMEPANVVDGLFAIARGLQAVAKAIHALGTNNAAYPEGGQPGAIELLAKEVRDGFAQISNNHD